jgi:hypothetical protein
VQCPRSPENRPMRVIPSKAGIHPLPGDVDPRLRGGDDVIFISSDGPQAHGNSVEGSGQQDEIRLGEFPSPPEQAHDDEEMGKKRTPEPRTRWYWAEARTRRYRAELRSVGPETRPPTG